MELHYLYLVDQLLAQPSPTPPSLTHLGGVTLETIPVVLPSDHNQMQSTLLGMKCYHQTSTLEPVILINSLYCCVDRSRMYYTDTVSAPPLNVRATQSGSSAPVEVSWSPPSDGANSITGYRIYYGNRQNLLVPSYVTRIVLNFVESNQIESVSVRSESTQLPSELITATVTTAGKPHYS